MGQPAVDEPDYLRMILNARVYNVAKETPLQFAPNLSKRFGCNIYLKREDLQSVFSFKLRGAYNRMAHLTAEERARGVITCSAGNHAQGVALSAKTMGISAEIVMPLATPKIKVRAVEQHGATVVLFGQDFDEAKAECSRRAIEANRVIIPPFDDPYVIAGQGTIAMEILRQFPGEQLDAVFTCVGGGGLLAGVSAYIKRVRPEVKVFGVNSEDSTAMTTSLQKGEIVTMNQVGLFADGAAVKRVGTETFRVCKKYADGMLLANTDEICAAIQDTFEDTRSILEPAGALGLAGAKKYITQNNLQGANIVVVLSGANINFSRLRFVAERAEIGEKREALLSVNIPEVAGSFQKLYDVIFPRNVTEFSYRYNDTARANIFVAFEVTERDREIPEIIAALAARDMKALDLSDNEMAKSHARYIAGGRSATVTHERLFQFQFPERLGALKQFLSNLNSEFNVSLFHYRNHGSDVGRVLTGIQVPPEHSAVFDTFLARLAFPYTEETNNPVYIQFLK